jgi:hypothetical protein
MAIPKLISKSRLMRGFRCHKNLYFNIHDPKLEAPVSADQQALFDQGNLVGEMARKRFPGGMLVDCEPWDFGGSLKKTRDLLAVHTETIYEAAFEFSGCYARADIIRHSPVTRRWTIYEVKSSTRVKPEQIEDVGLQAWIIAKSGLPIERINILHLNPECRHPNLESLFVEQDVTETLRELYPTILPRVKDCFSMLQRSDPPAQDIGPHCFSPGDCGFREVCWNEKNIPPISVFDLPQIRDKKWDFYKEGIVDIADPRLRDLTPLQDRVVECHRTGKRFVDADGVRSALSAWRFPLVFLDFETISPAIPRYNGCRPYGHTPFQFSVHLWKSPGAELEHLEYLHTDATDPRPKLIPALLSACSGEGSIVAYYSQFESSRIKEMADAFPAFSASLDSLLPRMVDPLPVIRDFIYDPSFAGSFSLKAVAPALLGDGFSYDGMDVENGTAAQRAFEEMIAPETAEARSEKLRFGLLEYCKKDTLVMAELVRWLHSTAGLSA